MKTTNLKSIHQLLFACDHNSLSFMEFMDADGALTVTTKPTLVVAEMVEQSIRDGLRVAFLIDENNEKYTLDENFALLHDKLEFIHLPQLNKQSMAVCCQGFAADLGEVLLIAADRKVRAVALESGMQAVAHPAMVKSIVDNQQLVFARLEGLKSKIQRLPDVVPYYLETHTNDDCQLFGSLSTNSIAQAVDQGINVQIYPVDIASHDFLFVRVEHSTKRELFSALKNKTVLSHEKGRIMVALGADEQNDSIKLKEAHGHYWYLMPSPELLQPNDTDADKIGFTMDSNQIALMHSLSHSEIIEKIDLYPKLKDKLDLLFPCCPMTANEYQNTVDRYSGVAVLDSAGTIQSREVRHSDNERVVNALLSDLRAMGYCAWTHSFSVAGRTAKNVIGELPGRGYFRIDPKLIDKIRNILDLHQLANPVKPWLSELEKVLGLKWSAQLQAQAKTPWKLRRLAELQLGIYQYPVLRCPVAGYGARLVLVGCHLDSTAAYDGQFDPASDVAPGADDDASGIAGTLAAAKFMTNYRNKLTHSVRFCFFNAEELGIVGSQAYAAYLKSINAKVKATVCMDMIGYNSDANSLFEVHAGYTDPVIRDQSVPIANEIASSAAQLGNLAPAQIYQGTIGSSGSNRNTHDGAINRSDHASFHQQGYPAVVVSEDFFINQAGEPSSDANPNYHRSSDTFIDSSYGADIACAVAHAVKKLAE